MDVAPGWAPAGDAGVGRVRGRREDGEEAEGDGSGSPEPLRTSVECQTEPDGGEEGLTSEAETEAAGWDELPPAQDDEFTDQVSRLDEQRRRLALLQSSLERYATNRAEYDDVEEVDGGMATEEARVERPAYAVAPFRTNPEEAVLDTFREVLEQENQLLNLQIYEQERRRRQLDGVIHEVADQLEAFRRLQRLLGLLTTIEGMFQQALAVGLIGEAAARQGLSPQQLERCGDTLCLQAEDGQWEGSCCVVCLMDFCEDAEVRQLPCLHFYHRPCIDRWLSIATTCPVCKCDYAGLSASPEPDVPWDPSSDLLSAEERWLSAAVEWEQQPPANTALGTGEGGEEVGGDDYDDFDQEEGMPVDEGAAGEDGP
eukprot:EG_transcript_14252